MSSAFNIPAGWREAIAEIRNGLNDATPSAFDNSGYRDYAGIVLDAVEDALSALAATPPVDAVPGEPVGEVAKIVMFGGDLKEVSWRNGKMPAVGTKLYAASVASRAGSEPVAPFGWYGESKFENDFTTNSRVRRIWEAHGRRITPLYAAPSTLRQPEAAGEAPAEGSEKQRFLELLAAAHRAIDGILGGLRRDTAHMATAKLVQSLTAPAAAAEPSEPDWRTQFGDLSFNAAKKIILDMDAEAARGLAISLLIQQRITDKVLAALIDRERAASLVASEGLSIAQEPKYTVNGSAIVNRASGEAIPADEPVFIFRARDVRAIGALSSYASVVALHSSEDHWLAVMGRIDDFVRFRRDHPERMKEPDTASAGEAQS